MSVKNILHSFDNKRYKIIKDDTVWFVELLIKRNSEFVVGVGYGEHRALGEQLTEVDVLKVSF